MAIQITVDPTTLTEKQREAVAGFILAFPAAKESSAVINITNTTVDGTSIAKAMSNELEVLQHDHESTLPDAAFGPHGSAALDAVFSQGAAGPTLADVGLTPAAAFGIGKASADPFVPSATTVPPPPESTVPTPPTPGPASSVAPAASGGVELDKRGLPWDNRIHSSSKAKLANGDWKNARGKAPEYIAQVEAELLGAIALTTRTAAQGVPPAPVVPTAPQVAPLPPVVPVAPSANADPATFEQLMPRITAAVAAAIMPPTAVGAACAAHGIASVVTLQQNPAYIPLVWATLKQQYPALV